MQDIGNTEIADAKLDRVVRSGATIAIGIEIEIAIATGGR